MGGYEAARLVHFFSMAAIWPLFAAPYLVLLVQHQLHLIPDVC